MTADRVNGILVRGADRKAYFLPEDVLAQYKLDGDAAAEVDAVFDQDVAGFDFGSSIDGFDVPIVALQALEGPMAIPSRSTHLEGAEKQVYSFEFQPPMQSY